MIICCILFLALKYRHYYRNCCHADCWPIVANALHWRSFFTQNWFSIHSILMWWMIVSIRIHEITFTESTRTAIFISNLFIVLNIKVAHAVVLSMCWNTTFDVMRTKSACRRFRSNNFVLVVLDINREISAKHPTSTCESQR